MHKYNDIRDVSELARKVYEYEQMSLVALFELLKDKYESHGKKATDKLTKAFELGKHFHAGQKRKSGAPYFTHPLIVAILLSDHHPDEDTLVAAMLHDVIEDTDATKQDLEAFGTDVREMIDGLTKINKDYVDSQKAENDLHVKLETIRKILQFGERDMRVIIIKIFDRLHNILTLFWKENLFSRDRYLRQTLDIYVPIAKRVGLRGIYHEFLFHVNYYLRNHRFHQILSEFEKHDEKMVSITKIITSYANKASETQVNSISFSRRNLFDMQNTEKPNSLPLDRMYFIEIVVPDEEDCYNLLKDLNNPVDSTLIPVGVVRDFVSRPKLSQYRALQFECIIKGKDRIRVHILSEEMHERKQSLLSIDELREIYSPVLFHDFDLIDEATRSSSDRFIQSVMSQVFSKKMQIHSPKKNEVYVPYDFTALDAAIYLYPEKIKYISKILVNHTPATFDQELHPNDIIEVTFGSRPNAKAEWIKYLSSDLSRVRLQRLLKEENQNMTIQYGKKILQEHFDSLHLGSVDALLRSQRKKIGHTPEEVYQMVGQGSLLPLEVIEKIGKTQRSFVMRILRWLATHLPIVRAIDEMYSPYIFFTFQSTEMSTQRLTQEIQDACDRTNVILHKILCYRQDHGYKCKVRLIGEDKKDLFRAFIKVSQSNHIYETRVHLKRRFKVRIGLLFLFTILMWTIFLVFLPSFIRVSPLFAYVEIIPPIIINIFLYNFCLHYFSSLRYNKAILILVTVLNILAVLIYTVIVLNTGAHTFQLNILFPVVLGVFSSLVTILLFYRNKGLAAEKKPVPLSQDEWSKRKKEKIIGYSIRFGAVVVWGIQHLYLRYGIPRDVSPYVRIPFIFLGGLIVSLLILGIFLTRKKVRKAIHPLPINKYLVILTASLLVLYLLFNLSLVRTTSTSMILINNFAPVAALIIGTLFWRREIPYLKRLRSMISIYIVFFLGSIGGILIVLSDIQLGVSAKLTGDLIALGVMAVDIIVVISQFRYVGKNKDIVTPLINIYTFGLGTILSFAILAFFLGSIQLPSMGALASVVTAGAIAGFGMILNYEAFKRIDGFIAFLMFNISIIISFVAEVFFFDEITLTPIFVVGALLIVGSSIMAEFINSRAEKKGL